MTDKKPTLVLDFDGVIHAYTSPWTSADEVRDGAVPGAIDFLVAATKVFEVAIVSSRSHEPGGRAAMRDAIWRWIAEAARPEGTITQEQGIDLMEALTFPEHKPAAFLTIDDRALTFSGTWPRPEALLAFKPWNKGGPAIPRTGLGAEVYEAARQGTYDALVDMGPSKADRQVMDARLLLSSVEEAYNRDHDIDWTLWRELEAVLEGKERFEDAVAKAHIPQEIKDRWVKP